MCWKLIRVLQHQAGQDFGKCSSLSAATCRLSVNLSVVNKFHLSGFFFLCLLRPVQAQGVCL